MCKKAEYKIKFYISLIDNSFHIYIIMKKINKNGIKIGWLKNNVFEIFTFASELFFSG